MPLFNNEGLDDSPAFEACESFVGGQVSYARPSILQPTQAAKLQDVVTQVNGELRTRPGTRDIRLSGVNPEPVNFRGVVLRGTSEFAYKGDAVLLRDDGRTFNSIYDERVLKKLPTDPYLRTDIAVTLGRMAEKHPGVVDVLIWVQWYYPTDLSTGPKPCISPTVKAKLVNVTDWEAGGEDGGTGIELVSDMGGTPIDQSIVWLFDELKSRGYTVGIVPVPMEDSNDPGSRSEIAWPDDPTFEAWMDDYELFVKYYIDLLKNEAAYDPDYIILGSELKSSTIYDLPNFPFTGRLQGLAAYAKTQFAGSNVTYAAAHDEYSYAEGPSSTLYYPLDAFWSDANVDLVGVDYFFPITQNGVSTNETDLILGLGSGPDWDYTRDTPGGGDGGRTLSTSLLNDVGFSNVGTTPLTEHFRLKDLAYWREALHYELFPDRTTDALSRPSKHVLSGPAMDMESAPTVTGGGNWKPAQEPDTFIDSGPASIFATGVFPNIGKTYSVEIKVNLSVNGSGSERTVFTSVESGNLANILILSDATGMRFLSRIIYGVSSSEETIGVPINVLTPATEEFIYRIEVNGATNKYTEYKNGIVINSAVTFSGTPRDFTETIRLNHGTGIAALKVHQLSIAGGAVSEAWDFSDGTLGYYTEWSPIQKPIFLTGCGVASIRSASVEPGILPNFLTAPADPSGPFNSSFLQDLGIQSRALRVMTIQFASMISGGVLSGYCVYNMDARPWEAIANAQNDAETGFYYFDRGNFFYDHAVNGKAADGGGVIEEEHGMPGPVQGLTYFDTPTIDRLIAVSAGAAYWLTSSGWEPYFIFGDMNGGAAVDMVQLVNNLYVTGAQNGLLYKWNGSAVSQVASGPDGATILVRHGTRLIASGYQDAPDALDFSDLLDGDTWDFTNQRLYIGGGDGDPIVAVVSWINRSLVVIKRNSVWVVNADPLIDVVDMNVELVHASVGGVGKRAVAQVGQDVWFLSKFGVHSIRKQLATSNNEITTPVSQSIQDVIESINWADAGASCAVFHDNFFLLSVPVNGSNPDTILTLNYLTGGWTTFSNWGASCFCEQPYNGKSRLVFGRPDGTVREWLNYLTSGSMITTDNGAPIDSRVTTRGMIFGEPANPKSGLYAELEVVKNDALIEVSAMVDGDTESVVFSETIASGSVSLPATLPFTLGAPGYARRTMPLQGLRQFRELQLDLRCQGDMRLRKIVAGAFIDTIELNTRGT